MENQELQMMRHSAAHIMAAAVQKIYPDAKFDIGPGTNEGFYYDFDMEHRLVPEDFKEIEKEMKKMIGRNLPFIRTEVSREEARKFFGRGSMELIVRAINSKDAGGEGLADEYIRKYAEVCNG